MLYFKNKHSLNNQHDRSEAKTIASFHYTYFTAVTVTFSKLFDSKYHDSTFQSIL